MQVDGEGSPPLQHRQSNVASETDDWISSFLHLNAPIHHVCRTRAIIAPPTDEGAHMRNPRSTPEHPPSLNAAEIESRTFYMQSQTSEDFSVA